MKQWLRAVFGMAAVIVLVTSASCSPSAPESEPGKVQTPEDMERLLAASLNLIPVSPATPSDLEAVVDMGESGNPSYIPVLVEFLRFPWQLDNTAEAAVLAAIAKLSGESESAAELTPEQREWDWWVDWLGRHPEIEPVNGYAGWKGQLLSRLVDPSMGLFLYEGVKANIRLEEIVWGGVVKDGIPDLTNPPTLTAPEASYLNGSDRVFGVSINGEHRAYPLRILNPHEMANDVVGGVPFALAY